MIGKTEYVTMIDRTPQNPPSIKPVEVDSERPLWSVMIPSYNCSKYLKATIESVLVQVGDRDDTQITVVDDFSTDDDIEALVTNIGKGRVSLFKQTQNVGSLRNFETCINISKGKLIHILHGDDMVKPGFYQEVEKLFNDFPTIGAAFTGILAIDQNNTVIDEFKKPRDTPGIVEDLLFKIAQRQFLQTCGVVVKRSVYEELGGFYLVHYGEDWEMWARIASKFQVASSPKNLALYRVHNNNISTRYIATGQNIRDIKTVINTIQHYLPAEKRKELKRIASRNFALYFSGASHGIYRNSKARDIALKQAKHAMLLHLSPRTVKSFIKLYIKTIFNYRPRLDL